MSSAELTYHAAILLGRYGLAYVVVIRKREIKKIPSALMSNSSINEKKNRQQIVGIFNINHLDWFYQELKK